MDPQAAILGIPIHVTSYPAATQHILHWCQQQQGHMVVAANVHVVMSGVEDPEFRQILSQADLVTPDGMPLVWALRSLGYAQATRVYGPDLMLEVCQGAADQKIPIFLYGSTPATLEQLSTNLLQRFPTLIIAGTLAPPFRALTEEESRQHILQIRSSGARIVFVGLGCPKQERWIAQHRDQLPGVLMGVGAAFSFHSGQVSQAPRWMMKAGLEWLYRFCQEPRRLWRRYLVNNPLFLIRFGGQWVRHSVWPERILKKK